MNSRKFLILISAIIFLLLITGSISTAKERELLVLMPLQGTGIDLSSEYKKLYSRSGVYREKTVPVKSFSQNSLGLYDMTGNVEEWVQDWYDGGYYKKSPRNNPKGPNNGSSRVMRGGSWLSEPRYVRMANRDMGLPSRRLSYEGFRLALWFSARTD